MNYKVVFVDRAITDLTEIEEYIALNELLGRVDKIINKIIDACRNLERFLFLGHHPKEILEHNEDIWETGYKVYRIFCEVKNDIVIIEGIIDGHRNIRELLLGRIQD